MANIQQFCSIALVDNDDESAINKKGRSSQHSHLTATVLAVHRRSLHIMTYNYISDKFRVLEMRSIEERPLTKHLFSKRIWHREFTASNTIVSVLPLEAHDVFMIIVKDNANIVRALFINFSGEEVNAYDFPKMNPDTIVSSVRAADFDQFRKDLIIAGKQGVVTSYSVRQVGSGKDNRQFQLIFRRRNKLSLEDNQGSVPLKLLTHDITSLTIILFENDGIACIDSATLDQLWHVDISLFVLPPINIWADKFGSDFVVHCKHRKKIGQELLEYWIPPTNFQQCNRSQFSRLSLPISGIIDHVVVETFESKVSSVPSTRGPHSGPQFTGETYVVVVMEAGKVYLWHPLGSERSTIILECQLTIQSANIDTNTGQSGSRQLSTNVRDSVAKYLGVSFFAGTLPLTVADTTLLISNGPHLVASCIHNLSSIDQIYRTIGNDIIAQLSENNGISQWNRSIQSPYSNIAKFLMAGMTSQQLPGSPQKNSVKFDDTDPDALMESSEALYDRYTTGSSMDSVVPTPDAFDDELRSNLNTADDRSQQSFPVASGFGHPGRNMSEYSLPSLGNDGSLEISTTFENIRLMNCALNHNPKDKSQQKIPVTQNFAPLSMFSDGHSHGLLRLVQPPSLLLLDDNISSGNNAAYSIARDSKLSQPKIFQFNRGGLADCLIQNKSTQDSSIDVTLCSYAYRSHLLGVVTTLKEGLIFNLGSESSKSSIDSSIPLRIELEVRALASITAIRFADISLNLGHEVSKNKASIDNGSGKIVGSQFLFLVGDSDGILHYAITNKKAVISQGTFQAHGGSEISDILTTGDAMKPLWRVGITSAGGAFDAEPVPGGSLVTVSKAGEVRVWQPHFIRPSIENSSSGVVVRAAHPEKVLSICSVEWKLVGLFSGRPVQAPSTKHMTTNITSVSLDPSCLTLLVGNIDGSLDQWSIPGLLDHINYFTRQIMHGNHAGSLSTCREPVWSSRRHGEKISSSRIWMHLSDTSLKDSPAYDNVAVAAAAQQAASIVTYGRASKGSKSTISYTRKQLRFLAESSSLVTCQSAIGHSSHPSSIILWRFMVSQQTNTEDQTSLGPSSLLLNPFPCRQLDISGSIHSGLCYCISSPQYSNQENPQIWKLDVVVNGIVITALEGERQSLFSSAIDEQSDLSNIITGNQAISDIQESPVMAESAFSMPVICKIAKPLRIMAAISQRLPQDVRSWKLLDTWAKLLQQSQLDESKGIVSTSSRGLSSLGDSMQVDVPHTLAEMNLEIDEMVPKEVTQRFEIAGDGRKKFYFEGIRIAANYAEECIELLKDSKKIHQRHKVDYMEDISDTYSTISDDLSIGSKSLGATQNDDIADTREVTAPIVSNKLSISINTAVGKYTSNFREKDNDGMSEEIQQLAIKLLPFSSDAGLRPHSPSYPIMSSRLGSPSSLSSLLNRRPISPNNLFDGLEIVNSASSRSGNRIGKAQTSNTSAENIDSKFNIMKIDGSLDNENPKDIPKDGITNDVIIPKLTKAVLMRQAMQVELKARLDVSERKRAAVAKVTYTSKTGSQSLFSSVQPIGKNKPPTGDHGGHYAGAAVFGMPKNFSESKLKQSKERVVVGPKAPKGVKQSSREQIQTKDFTAARPDSKINDNPSIDLGRSVLNELITDSMMSFDENTLKKVNFDQSDEDAISHLASLIDIEATSTASSLHSRPESRLSSPKISSREATPATYPQDDASLKRAHALGGGIENSQSHQLNDSLSAGETSIVSSSTKGTKSRMMLFGDSQSQEDLDAAMALPATYFDHTAPAIARRDPPPAVKRLESKRHGHKSNEAAQKERENELLAFVYQTVLETLNTEEQSDLASILGTLSTTELGSVVEMEVDNQAYYIDEALESYNDVKNHGLIAVSDMAIRLLTKAKSAKLTVEQKLALKNKRRKMLDLQVALGDISDCAIELAVRPSAFPCKAVVLLFRNSANSIQPLADDDAKIFPDFIEGLYEILSSRNLEKIRFISGLVSISEVDITSEGSEKIVFDKLSFSVDYKVFTYIYDASLPPPNSLIVFKDPGEDKGDDVSVTSISSEAYNSQGFHPVSLQGFKSNKVEFKTLPEYMDIPWMLLSSEMKDMEIRALSRCPEIFKIESTGGILPSGIVLLSDEDILAKTPEASDPAGRTATKKWNDFIDWWTNYNSAIAPNPVRSQFLFLESLFTLRSPSHSRVFLDKCREQKALTQEECAKLISIVTAMDPRTATTYRDTPLDCIEYVKFRSWYRGGAVLESFIKQQEPAPMVASLQDAIVPDAEVEVEQVSIGASVSDAVEVSNHHPILLERLQSRTRFLTERIASLDEAKSAVVNLVDHLRHLENFKISVEDMEKRRSKLKPDDIRAIMGFLKLQELCVERKICTKAAAGSLMSMKFGMVSGAGYSIQSVTGLPHLFVEVDLNVYKPDEPPGVEGLPLPGTTNRKPLKPWTTCSVDEQRLEVMLACSFDDVIELATIDGLAVPDPEDSLCDKKIFPAKSSRWNDFVAWYAGDEEKNKTSGLGFPTLARVIFCEQWEIKMLENDLFVPEAMRSLDMEIPLDKAGSREGALPAPPPPFSRVENDILLVKSALIVYYEDSILLTSGIALRYQLLQRGVNIIMTARRVCASRFLNPPGPFRTSSNYMFPVQGGLVIPRMEMPPKRYKLYPSIGIEAYTVEEILGWYSEEEFDHDDLLMLKSEAKGAKRRAYMDWLAKEDDRVEESRSQMFEEDELSSIRRQYWKKVEDVMTSSGVSNFFIPPQELALDAANLSNPNNINDNENEQDIDKPGPDTDNNHDQVTAETWNYVHTFYESKLPDDFEEIFESATEYRYGSGLKNEDELEEIIERQETAARAALDKETKLQSQLKEERLKRERDENVRARREEQDRRLKEGVERRRLMREHFEDIKIQREARIAELAMQQQDEIAAQKLRCQQEEEQRRMQRVNDDEKQRELRERLTMAADEYALKELFIRRVEVTQMRDEDRLGKRREKYESQFEKYRDDRMQDLTELYQEFVPYEFKKERVKLTQLHRILGHDDTIDHNASVQGDRNRNMQLDDTGRLFGNQTKYSDLEWQYFDDDRITDPNDNSKARTKGKMNDELKITIPAKKSIFVLKPMESSVTNYFHKLDLDDPMNPVSGRLQSAKATPSEPHMSPTEILIEDILAHSHDTVTLIEAAKLMGQANAAAPRSPRSAKAHRRIEGDRVKEFRYQRSNTLASLTALFDTSAVVKPPLKAPVVGVRGVGNLADSKRKHPMKLQKITVRSTDMRSGVSINNDGDLTVVPTILKEAPSDYQFEPLSARTKRLSKEAAAAAEKTAYERQLVGEYMDSMAAMRYPGGKFYLDACKPGIKAETVIESSPAVRSFFRGVVNNLHGDEAEAMGLIEEMEDAGTSDKEDSAAPTPSALRISAVAHDQKRLKKKIKVLSKTLGASQSAEYIASAGPKLPIMGQVVAIKDFHPLPKKTFSRVKQASRFLSTTTSNGPELELMGYPSFENSEIPGSNIASATEATAGDVPSSLDLSEEELLIASSYPAIEFGRADDSSVGNRSLRSQSSKDNAAVSQSSKNVFTQEVTERSTTSRSYIDPIDNDVDDNLSINSTDGNHFELGGLLPPLGISKVSITEAGMVLNS